MCHKHCEKLLKTRTHTFCRFSTLIAGWFAHTPKVSMSKHSSQQRLSFPLENPAGALTRNRRAISCSRCLDVVAKCSPLPPAGRPRDSVPPIKTEPQGPDGNHKIIISPSSPSEPPPCHRDGVIRWSMYEVRFRNRECFRPSSVSDGCLGEMVDGRGWVDGLDAGREKGFGKNRARRARFCSGYSGFPCLWLLPVKGFAMPWEDLPRGLLESSSWDVWWWDLSRGSKNLVCGAICVFHEQRSWSWITWILC